MRLKCLDHQCSAVCSENFIKLIVEPEEFLKYKRFTNAFLVDTTKDLIFCPNKQCGLLVNKKIKPV